MFALGGAQAVFTNRFGGVSAPPFDRLNLGPHVGDAPEAVARNRAIVDQAVGHDVVWMKQTHSARVEVVKPGFTHVPHVADAIVADGRAFAKLGLAHPALGVMVADCLPVLLASEDGRYVAAVHAGRAGVVMQIIPTVLQVLARMGAPATQMHAALGPAICASCYEVDRSTQDFVLGHVPAAWSTTRRGTPALDLRAGAIDQLRQRGVNVSFSSKRCTAEDPNLYSYRRDGVTGRFAGIIVPAS